MKNQFKLSKSKKEEMVVSIQHYFLQERGEELGDLAAQMMLDFFIEQLAPEFYNQGVSEAHDYLAARLEDVLSIQKY